MVDLVYILRSPVQSRGVANAKWNSALGSWYHGWGPSPAVLEKKPFFVWGNGFLIYCCHGLGVKGTHFEILSAFWDPAVFPVQIIGNPKKRNLFSKVLLTSIFPLENDSFLIFQWFCEYQSMVFLLSKSDKTEAKYSMLNFENAFWKEQTLDMASILTYPQWR